MGVNRKIALFYLKKDKMYVQKNELNNKYKGDGSN